MKVVTIENITRPLASPLQARYCVSFWCKLRGLSFYKSLSADDSLLLVEKTNTVVNAAIHMLWMRFDLGIVWINDRMEVVDLAYAKKWVSFIAPKQPAKYSLEIVPDRLGEFQVGDQLGIE